MFYTWVQCKFQIIDQLSANDIAKEKKRSKITADDVYTALKELGFDKYEDELKEFLKNYNADKEDQARTLKAKKREAASE